MLKGLTNRFSGGHEARARGLDDPVPGALRLSAEEGWWEASVAVGSSVVRFRIGGDAEPSRQSVARARDIVLAWADFELKVAQFLAGEARRQRHYADEIRQLVIEEICLDQPGRPDDGTIYFSGPDEFRLWRCDYVNRRPERLGFDS